MKTKILLVGFFLFTIPFSFGQVKTGNGNKGVSGTATGDWKPNQQVTPTTNGNNGNTNQTQNTNNGNNGWSNWLEDRCFTGIKYKIRTKPNVNNKTHVEIDFKNTYNTEKLFGFRIFTNAQDLQKFPYDTYGMQSDLRIGVGETRGQSLTADGTATGQIFVVIWRLRDTFDGKFQKCTNGTYCKACETNPGVRCLNYQTANNSNSNNQNTGVSEHDRIYVTNSNNQSQNPTPTQQNQGVINSTSQQTPQNNQIVIEPDKSYEMTKQVFDISSNFVNAMQAQAVIEEKNNANIQNKELVKLEIESDFNDIHSPEDYENVSLTSLTYKNLLKLANVEVHKECGSAFANPETINGKAKKSLKIESAFLGANTVFIKNFDVSRDNRYSYNRCVFEIFGFAQTNKILNFEEIQKVLTAGKYEILNAYKFKKNDDEFSKEKFTKDIEIMGIRKNGNFIEITANIKNVKTDKFRLINFNEEQFVLFYQDNDKLYNYIVKRN